MERIRYYILALLLFVAAPLVCGCGGSPSSPVYTKDGREYGKSRGAFRHRWWNYYERGLSYAEGEFHKEAIADLAQAAKQRERDQRRARTYGMHFIDYFPHRELGVAHYQMGDLETAGRELELSIGQFPTAKARFYLDRVRKGLMDQEGRELAPPGLTLDFQTDEIWTRDDPVFISGVAEDERYVSGIRIRGAPVYMEGAQERIAFNEPLALSQGRHPIVVEAKNLLGGVVLKEVVIHVDREGPQIAVEQLRSEHTTSGREVVIHGSVYDEAGVSHLSMNERPIPIQKGREVPFVRKLIIDSDTIELKAIDRLGNRTSALIDLSAASATVMVHPHPDPPPSRGRDVYGSASGGGAIGRSLARYEPVMLASVQSDLTHLAGLFGQSDTRPPRILLKDWTDTQTVFLNKIYLEGQASDESGIESLSINQVPILRRKGRRVFFSHLAELAEGKNTITIEAGDEAGNVAAKEISVIRCVPKALQLAERLSLTVVPFEQKGLVPDSSFSFLDNLIDALVNQDRFNIVEREKLDVILQEHKISNTKLIDRNTALRMGRLTAAQCIIMGNIIETRTGIEIVARMIDTETSEILTTEDVYDEIKDLPALRSLAQGMAIKFHRKFPLLEGLVIQQKGNYLFTDLGQDKVRLKTRLIAYSEEPVKHSLTGKTVGTENEIIARARVIQVMPEMSKAEILDGKAVPAKSPTKVITQ